MRRSARAAAFALVLTVAVGCRTLAEERGPASSDEIQDAIERVDAMHEQVIELTLTSTLDAEKAFWVKLLDRLGDQRESLTDARDQRTVAEVSR
ncbi:MAG: hypothetical protein AAGB93_25100 [Planctomycetota bacterium]